MVAANSRSYCLSYIIFALIICTTITVESSSCIDGGEDDDTRTCVTNLGRWEDAPSSNKEFDHDNDKTVCRLPIISVEEWENGRYWEKEEPVIVQNVTDGWLALEHWTK